MTKEDIPKHFRDKRTKSSVLARTRATDRQWYLINIAVVGFMRKYPAEWYEFQRQLKADRTKYQLATKDHKDLRKASWRNVAAFPIIEDAQGNEIDSLLPVLKRIIPELTHKSSVNLIPFLRKYPVFMPGEKV
jgi:hypothetical protein